MLQVKANDEVKLSYELIQEVLGLLRILINS